MFKDTKLDIWKEEDIEMEPIWRDKILIFQNKVVLRTKKR